MWIGGRDTGNAKGETVGECARVGVWVGVCVGKKRASVDWVSEQVGGVCGHAEMRRKQGRAGRSTR